MTNKEKIQKASTEELARFLEPMMELCGFEVNVHKAWCKEGCPNRINGVCKFADDDDDSECGTDIQAIEYWLNCKAGKFDIY